MSQKNKRKISKQYFISVEGQSEKWYLEHLQWLINESARNKSNVSFVIKVAKATTAVKSWTILDSKSLAFHFQDYEENTISGDQNFHNVINDVSNAKSIKGNICYELAYSNLTFELWLILHKEDVRRHFSNKNDYLPYIQRLYDVEFQSLREMKEEKNFKNGILSQITLQNIMDAIQRSEDIDKMHRNNGDIEQVYCGYRYYRKNPALNVHTVIKRVLRDAGLIKKQ